MNIIEPHTAEWWEARLGAWTSSRAPALMSRTKKRVYCVNGEQFTNQTDAAKAFGASIPKLKKAIEDPAEASVYEAMALEDSADFIGLIKDIACERITQTPTPHFVTPAMRRGIELEDDAAKEYALTRGVKLGPSGLVMHPTLERVCGTPDRFIGDDGLLEIKAPFVPAKHLDMLLGDDEKTLVKEYEWQCLHQLWVTGRQWCDLASYAPEFGPRDCLAVVRIKRDEAKFAELEASIALAEQYVREIVGRLERRTLGAAA